MFERFGEFDSAEEMNRAAKAQREEGDEEALVLLAAENGIDREDAEDFMDGCTEEFVSPLMAAEGKLKVEAEALKLAGIAMDWKDTVVAMCAEEERMAAAVRKKGKRLAECVAGLISFSFENKVRISDEIVDITYVMHNVKKEKMRKPLYLGIPGKAETKRLVRKYYLGKENAK